jgi:hypothetical protein
MARNRDRDYDDDYDDYEDDYGGGRGGPPPNYLVPAILVTLCCCMIGGIVAIVNAAHVREVRSSGDGRYNIYLHGGQALPLGRARREILERLLSGIGGRQN